MSTLEHPTTDMSPEEAMRAELRAAADQAGNDFTKLVELSNGITARYEKAQGVQPKAPTQPVSTEAPRPTKTAEVVTEKKSDRIKNNFKNLQSLTELASVKKEFKDRESRVTKTVKKSVTKPTARATEPAPFVVGFNTRLAGIAKTPQNSADITAIQKEIEGLDKASATMSDEQRLTAIRSIREKIETIEQPSVSITPAATTKDATIGALTKLADEIEEKKDQLPNMPEPETPPTPPDLSQQIDQAQADIKKTIDASADKALADIDARLNDLLQNPPDYLRSETTQDVETLEKEKTPAALVAEARQKYLKAYEKHFKNKNSFTRGILNLTHATGILRKDKLLSPEAAQAKNTYERMKDKLETSMMARLEQQGKSKERIEQIMQRYRTVATSLDHIERESSILNKARTELFESSKNPEKKNILSKTLGWYAKKFTPAERKAIGLGIAVGAGFMTGGMSTALVGGLRVLGGTAAGFLAQKVGDKLWKGGENGSYQKRIDDLQKEYMAGTITPSQYQQRKEGLELLNNRAEALKTAGVLAAGFGGAAGIGQISDTAIESLLGRGGEAIDGVQATDEQQDAANEKAGSTLDAPEERWSDTPDATIVPEPEPTNPIQVYKDTSYVPPAETPVVAPEQVVPSNPTPDETIPSIEGVQFEPISEQVAPLPETPAIAPEEALPTEIDSTLLSEEEQQRLMQEEQVPTAGPLPGTLESTPESLDLSPEDIDQILTEEASAPVIPETEPATAAPIETSEPVLDLSKEDPAVILDQPVENVETEPVVPAPVTETPIAVPELSFESDPETGLETAALDPQTEKLQLLNQYFGKHDFVTGDYLDPQVWTPEVQNADAGVFLRSPLDAVPEPYKAFHTDLKALTLKYNVAIEGRRIDDVITTLAEKMIAQPNQ